MTNNRPPRDIPPAHSLTIAVVCFILALICFGILLSGCASSSLGRGLNVALVGAAASDVISTEAAKDRGAVEGNAIVGQTLLGHLSVKAAGLGAVFAGTRLLDRHHRVLAHVIRVAVAGVWYGAAIHNAHLLRGQ